MNHKKVSRISIANSLCLIICLISAYLLAGCMSSLDPIPHGSQAERINSTIIVTDIHGTIITFPQPVKRIISANPHTAEILVAIDAGDLSVGITDDVIKNQPYVIKKSPNSKSIGTAGIPNIETLIALRPDVLIHSVGAPQNIDQIRAANITVLSLGCYDLVDMPNTTRVLGMITGKDYEAERYIQFSKYYLSLIENRVENISESDKPTVYLGIKDNVVFTNGSRGDNLIKFINARNIAGNLNLPGGWTYINSEWIIAQNPDIIITSSPYLENISIYRNDFITKSEYSSLNAIKNQRVYSLSTYLLGGPRAFIGYLYIAKAVYPERFMDIDPEQVLLEYDHEFVPGSASSSMFCPQLPVNSFSQMN